MGGRTRWDRDVFWVPGRVSPGAVVTLTYSHRIPKRLKPRAAPREPERRLRDVPCSKAGTELLFEVVSRAYERTNLIVTTNLPFES